MLIEVTPDVARLTSRRQALIKSANVLLAICLGGRAPAQDVTHPVRRIDIHHHFFSKSSAARKYWANAPTLRSILQYTPAQSLDAMDQAGVRTSFLSSPIPFGDDRIQNQRDARIVARETNELGAKMVSEFRGRFGLFAVLPLPDVDASLREIEYALDTLKADGVGLVTSYGNKWLGDRAFEPVFDELNRRKAIVYSHPIDAPCCHNLLPETTPMTIEWLTDTSRAIWSMLNDGNAPGAPVGKDFSSRATRYADIRFVWSHAGGTLLGLVSRFLGPEAADPSAVPAKNSKLYHLRRFFYDTATSANPIQMRALKSLVGPSQIVFGSDFPFVPVSSGVRALEASGFTSDELRAIFTDNALRILSRKV